MRDKIFFFDIDGTLARRGVIPESNRKALRQLRELGYETFICSGRPPFYGRDRFDDLVDGCICCNGRYILYHGKQLFSNPLSEVELTAYLRKLDELECGYLLVSEEAFYCHRLPEGYQEMMIRDYQAKRQCLDPQGMQCLTFDVTYQDSEQLGRVIEAFKEKLIINDHHGSGSADCSTLDFDKGSAIAWLTDYFGLDRSSVYAFGDGYNDQAMFREAGHRIAMGNAVDVLKEKATYVTDAFDREGIWNALVKEGILKP